MEYIIGFMFCLCLVLIYDKFKPSKLTKVSKEEQEKEREIQEHYAKIMNYDVSQAYGGKK